MARFVKGQSGCPTGRPKGILDIRAKIAIEFAANNVDGINDLLAVMLDKGRSGDVPAAKLCYEYLLIKPKTQVEVEDNRGNLVQVLTVEQIEELATYRKKAATIQESDNEEGDKDE